MTKEDIIQELRDASESIDGIYYSNFIELNFAEFMVSKIFDNINNKTCKNCKFNYECDVVGLICDNKDSKLYPHEVDNTVCCNLWESVE